MHITAKERKYNINQTTAIMEHLRVCKHFGDIDNYNILASGNTDIELLAY